VEDVLAMMEAHPLLDDYWATKAWHDRAKMASTTGGYKRGTKGVQKMLVSKAKKLLVIAPAV
jgi:ribosomal protein L7Ae-like RNA K-turn-binding protein